MSKLIQHHRLRKKLFAALLVHGGHTQENMLVAFVIFDCINKFNSGPKLDFDPLMGNEQHDRLLVAADPERAPVEFDAFKLQPMALDRTVEAPLPISTKAAFRGPFFREQDRTPLQFRCAEMILHALAAPDEAVTRWEALIEADGYPDEMEAPRIDLDPYELADRLEAVGVKSNIARL
ncbi:hypothetical protein SDC9_144091 [bioreactor metagenome]|uniref:Uncharacterized protein n=1 Tax=bioreactor metagenome TaxID=1076179 RepID=A0A645E8G4_9ZZZZ